MSKVITCYMFKNCEQCMAYRRGKCKDCEYENTVREASDE